MARIVSIILTESEKKEVLAVFFTKTYVKDVLRWFAKKYPRVSKQAHKYVLKHLHISRFAYRRMCKAHDNTSIENLEEIELDTMWHLLDKAKVDPYKDCFWKQKHNVKAFT